MLYVFEESNKKDLEEVIISIENPDLFRMFGIEPYKSFLFKGEPGTGKTYFINYLKDRLNQKHFKTYIIDYEIGVYGTAYINQGAVIMERLFTHGINMLENSDYERILYVFDEADVIVGKRGHLKGHREDDKIVNVIMKHQQRIHDNETNEYMFFMTNFPDIIDEAVLRSQRIDKIITFENPTDNVRINYIREKINEINKNAICEYISDKNLEKLIDVTEGMTFADLKQGIDNAIRSYIFDEKKNMGSKEIYQIDCLTYHYLLEEYQKIRNLKRDKKIGFV